MTDPRSVEDVRSYWDAIKVAQKQGAQVTFSGTHAEIKTGKGSAHVGTSTNHIQKNQRSYLITLLKAIGLLLIPAICGLYVWLQMVPYF